VKRKQYKYLPSQYANNTVNIKRERKSMDQHAKEGLIISLNFSGRRDKALPIETRERGRYQRSAVADFPRHPAAGFNQRGRTGWKRKKFRRPKELSKSESDQNSGVGPHWGGPSEKEFLGGAALSGQWPKGV